MTFVTTLQINDSDLCSLSFIKHMKSLIQVDVQRNKIVDPEQFVHLQKLKIKELFVDGNECTKSNIFTAIVQKTN